MFKLLSACTILLFMALLLLSREFVTCKLEDKLSNFEVVYLQRQRTKRGLQNPDPSLYNRIDMVQFYAFGRPWKVFLTPRKGVLHRNFRAVLRDNENGKSSTIPIDPNDFYEGHVYGMLDTKVRATLDGDNAITASIYTADDIYYFEPAWRHLEGVPFNATLAYKASALRSALDEHGNSQRLCGFVQADVPNVLLRSSNRHRTKRQSSTNKNRCPTKVVADYLFYKNVGGGSAAEAAKYLINVLDRVNEIFMTTDWGDGFVNQGLIIKDVLVHSSYTVVPRGSSYRLHYNMERPAVVNGRRWDVNQLLQEFSRSEGSNKYCLVHLFTSQAFQKGVLGLGYIADPILGRTGGMCCVADPQGVFFNTALSSTISTYGEAVVTREADIVTAHEIGHNWGSKHDSDPTCMPDLSNGGSYIMHTYSVSGYDPNNKLFSPCSKNSIRQVIKAKGPFCFEEHQEQFCGNQRIEAVGNDPEECDVGLLLDGREDRCCTHDCKLKRGAVCSPRNHRCCTEDCRFASSNEICSEMNRFSCTARQTCTGTSAECPKPDSIADGTTCLDEGECRNGTCVTFCERFNIGLKPCICRDPKESCNRCCLLNNKCTPYKRHNRPLKLTDGTKCIHGYCESGICKKEVQDIVNHLWTVIGTLDRSTFWIFIKRNLVIVTIFISLVIWIPISCLICYIDNLRDEEREMQLGDLFSDQGRIVDRDHIDIVRDGAAAAKNPWIIRS